MNTELFGVFGDDETFERLRPHDAFDAVVSGEAVTVGLREPRIGAPGWTATHSAPDGVCVVWGEAYAPDDADAENVARWLYERYEVDGREALSSLNGSYLVVLEVDGEATVVTDPVRSRACFYADVSGGRVFGTDSATVARTVEDPTLRRDAILEFLHLGVTLGEKTGVEQLRRLPIDACLTPHSVESLDRFVYDPREFDYAAALADRLRRAIRRRSRLPGRKGLLLSAGYDSRTFLSLVPDLERCYTVGSPSAQEVCGAKRLAAQYGVEHTAFPPDERYLLADEAKLRYSQGIKESLHIHHAGYTDRMDVDTVYHGLLADTFLRGHFTARTEVDVLGKRVPLERLDPDPDPVDTLLGKFGYDRAASEQLVERTGFVVDPDAFVRRAVDDELETTHSRAETTQNVLSCCGIANQPSTPFQDHLADNFFAAFLTTDTELIDWHLRTPPEHRTTDTFLRACSHLDESMLRHDPPDRPHDAALLNEVERFVRRKTPFLTPFESPWPDRDRLFDRYDLDRRLLPGLDHLYDLPARHKLRLADVLYWVDRWGDATDLSSSWLQPTKQSAIIRI